MVFLHPAQSQLVDRRYNGSARLTGSAGTGKTIVALHRAATLSKRYPQAKILLITLWHYGICQSSAMSRSRSRSRSQSRSLVRRSQYRDHVNEAQCAAALNGPVSTATRSRPSALAR